jgi:hypothetical protein
MNNVTKFRVRWHEDRNVAILETEDGEHAGWLRVQEWYRAGERTPSVAWIVAFLAPASPEPLMIEREVECPALVADTEVRRRALIVAAEAAMAAPSIVLPVVPPEPLPITAEQWGEMLQSQIDSWDETMGKLNEAARSEDEWAPALRYKALQEALHWLYVVDSTFTVIWRQLTDAERESLSIEADEQAAKAIANNKEVRPDLDPEQDAVFASYYERQLTGQAYQHWSDVLLAGAFHRRFFEAIKWVRGQLSHAATPAPMELIQYREGAEPRWKWSKSQDFARGRPDEAGRRAYDDVLSGRDVTGLLGHLTMVLVRAKYQLVGALRQRSTDDQHRA